MPRPAPGLVSRLAGLALVVLCPTAFAQGPPAAATAAPAPPPAAPAPAPAQPPPCAAAEDRQFDFWAGSWEVTLPDGRLAGTNVIEPILGGCVLREHWRGRGGLEGWSFNTRDRRTGRWHQTWVDSAGSLLLLAGELRDGSMVMAAESPDPGQPGRTVRQRITWTPSPDGSVRQHWESSADGTTWTTVFDGTYRRAAPAAAGEP
jgi:hypothetical protein